MGAGGAGKSSICDALSKDGEFKHVERDSMMESMWDEFGGFDQFRQTLLRGDRQSKREILRLLRKRIERLSKLLSHPEQADFSNALKRILEADDSGLIEIYTRDSGLLYYLICTLAEEEGIRKAAEIAKDSSKHVLLNDASLHNKDEFNFRKEYLNSQNIEPGLLVVRNTRERIREVAMERFNSGATQGLWQGRAAAAIAGMNEQISFPEIERVIICDNKGEIGEAVREIRERILKSEFEVNVKWPINLAC